MDIKNEIEIKAEPLEASEEDGKSELDSGSQIQEKVLVIENIEIKEEYLDIKREDRETDQHFMQISSGLDKNQTDICDVNYEEEVVEPEVKSSLLKSEPQTSGILTKKVKNSDLKSESSEKKLKCEHCGYECKYKSCLKVHLLKHSDTFLFKCSECSYECNIKRNMKSHMLIHTSTE
ncbi:Zinc finger protein, partial [Armadillidium vulgare]